MNAQPNYHVTLGPYSTGSCFSLSCPLLDGVQAGNRAVAPRSGS